jgi:hypothetical protein
MRDSEYVLVSKCIAEPFKLINKAAKQSGKKKNRLVIVCITLYK